MLIDFLFAVSHRVWSLYIRLDTLAWRMFIRGTSGSRIDNALHPVIDSLAGVILRIDSRVLVALENRLDVEARHASR